MATSAPLSSLSGSLLARRARELFVSKAAELLNETALSVRLKITALLDKSSNAREAQDRRDAWIAFQQGETVWTKSVAVAWKTAMRSPTSTTPVALPALSFELMGNEVMENKILSSRLALRILDKSSWELNDLMLRIRHLDKVAEVDRQDILRPEACAQIVVECWMAAGLSRDIWISVQDLLHQAFGERLVEAYHAVNAMLVAEGIMADVDLRHMVKRTPTAVVSNTASMATEMAPLADSGSAALRAKQGGRENSGTTKGAAASAGQGPSTGSGSAREGRSAVAQYAEASQQETRMMTSSTPLARAKMRAQGVMGQLKRMLTDKVAGFDDSRTYSPSPQLAAAMAQRAPSGYARTQLSQDGDPLAGAVARAMDTGPAAGGRNVAFAGFSENMRPDQAAGALREETNTLKSAAGTTGEKATIEIVALMFQSILTEDRIPAVVRVWFARLQMPVLRLALSEPEFFGSLQHPARRLIDRMGSCVLGFEADVSSAALETEIKRVVQVIEQYPETGRRVFQLVYEEFQKFLAKFLTEGATTQRVVSVAQQMEQKETAAIQYIIELRKMFGDLPVRDEIREFIFKVWSEVMAVAAVKHGSQHADTINLKQVAADLVWAASAKPNRADRAKVIQDLPLLLKRMRSGMALIGFADAQQDGHIKIISETLADAFMSKTESVDAKHIEALSKRLKNLEDFVSEDDVGDLPLDAESIELMLGIDTSGIDIITSGGSDPTEGMRAWALELDEGSWFNLDHNGNGARVQYAWRSERGQLHLFASPGGRTYLFQVRRLAAYLQAGLISPIEDETLTVRATRDALTKLDANPERLLAISII